MQPSGPDVLTWRVAATAAVAHLQQVLGFAHVVVARKRGDRWIALVTAGEDVSPGAVVAWADTVCARTADGRAAQVTPDARSVPAIQEAAAALDITIGSAVSLPLHGAGGLLLGSLCATSPEPRDESLRLAAPLLEVLAGLLAALLSAELRLQAQARRQEAIEHDGERDPVTALGNRRAWDRRTSAEELRCAGLGLSAGMLALDVDGLRAVNVRDGHDAGDAVLRSVALSLREVAGPDDVLARLGGGQFAVLLPECDAARLAAVVPALQASLAARAVGVGVGAALRGPEGLSESWHEADARMRVDKRSPRRNAVPAAMIASSSPSPTAGTDDVLLGELLELARRQLGASIAFVGQWQGSVRVMRAISSVHPLSTGVGTCEPLEDTYCQRILDGRLPRVIRDTALEPGARDLAATTDHGIGSYVGVPVKLPDGQLYGTLCCLSPHADATLTERDADFLAAVADSIGRVLEAEQREQSARSALVARLDPVLAGKVVTMVFQPVVSLHTGEVVGSEALARFGGDPPRPPAEWFDDGERAGLTGELELVTARAALASCASLPGFLSLNFSATTLCSPAFSGLLEHVDPARIVIEVSEHEAIDDYKPVLAALRPLRARGLRVAVDDAGAGFASLRHVVLLKPDLIKLDISLVRGIDADPTRQALANALTTFARQTDTQVVAEGVETEAERAVLRAAGVGFLQGWLAGAGLTAPEFIARWGARTPELPSPRPRPASVGG